MRVLVCGGRNYARRDLVDWRLDQLHADRTITVLINGACFGADLLAGEWAERCGVDVEWYPILPGEGGFRRNARMLLEGRPDLVVHFPGRRGTADMVRRAMREGVAVAAGLDFSEEQVELPLGKVD